MNTLKLSLALAAFAATFGLATTSEADGTLDVANGTYVFTDTDGTAPYLTGSTVTFLNDVLVSWNITDTPDNDIYTPINSFIPSAADAASYDAYEAGVYGVNDWAFDIIGNPYDSNYDPRTEIGNAGSSGFIYLQPSYTVSIDPTGTWTPADSPVPDAASSFEMLICSFGALSAGKALISRRKTPRR